MLLIYLNPATWESLTEEQREGIFRGHDEFQKVIRESGEMVGTEALSDPSNSAVVRVRDGVPVVTDGPYLETKEFFCGYYLVDCETKERAVELAALIPDAQYTAMEVRPLMSLGGDL
jgi:hypothetical protein